MHAFEYDPKKSASNLKKHGIDFDQAQAQALWQDINLIEISSKAKDEPRFLVIGKLKGKYWSAVITYREDNIRIISVRRSREAEVRLYEG